MFLLLDIKVIPTGFRNVINVSEEASRLQRVSARNFNLGFTCEAKLFANELFQRKDTAEGDLDKTSRFTSRVRVTRMLWSKVALLTLMDCRHSPGYVQLEPIKR